LERQPFRPVLEAAATYEPISGSLEVVAGDKDARDQIMEAAVTHLLRNKYSENEMPLRYYDLSVVLRPHAFATDPEDGIEEVQVRELRLMPIDDNARRVTLELDLPGLRGEQLAHFPGLALECDGALEAER
jgi:hypothetical protein